MSPAPIATSYRLPYQVDVQPPVLLSGGGTVVLRVIPVAPPDPSAAEDHGSVVTAFALLASTGALAGTAGPPAAAAKFDWSGPRTGGGALQWEFVHCSFDERAAVVLAQMFLLSHHDHPLARLTLAARGGAAVPLPYAPLLADPYPPVWQPTPFPVTIDPDLYDAATLRVQFSRTPTPEEQAGIGDRILTWAAATAIGAYGIAPVPPNECSAQFDPGVTFLGDELEFGLVRLRSHWACVYGLVNACIALHQSLVPIVELSLE